MKDIRSLLGTKKGVGASGDNIDSADWSLLTASLGKLNGPRRPGRDWLSVSHSNYETKCNRKSA